MTVCLYVTGQRRVAVIFLPLSRLVKIFPRNTAMRMSALLKCSILPSQKLLPLCYRCKDGIDFPHCPPSLRKNSTSCHFSNLMLSPVV